MRGERAGPLARCWPGVWGYADDGLREALRKIGKGKLTTEVIQRSSGRVAVYRIGIALHTPHHRDIKLSEIVFLIRPL